MSGPFAVALLIKGGLRERGYSFEFAANSPIMVAKIFECIAVN
jgi:hypothetical protein